MSHELTRTCDACGTLLTQRTRSGRCRACNHMKYRKKSRLKSVTPHCLACHEAMTRMAPDGLCGTCRATLLDETGT